MKLHTALKVGSCYFKYSTTLFSCSRLMDIVAFRLSFRPKPFIRFLTSLPPFTDENQKWVSTSTTQHVPQSSLVHSDDCLQSFVNNQSTQRGRNYQISVVSALKSCSTLLAISEGQQIHGLVFKSGLDSNTFIQNSLINLYVKCGFMDVAQSLFDSFPRLDPVSCNIMIAAYVKSGRLDSAGQLFDVMPQKGCVSYTTMIMGFAQNGYWKQAINLFKSMRADSVMPNEVTMSSVISSYSRTGGIWDCRMLHALVNKIGLEEFVLVSTNLVQMYGVCSSLREARALFDEMPEPNIVSWNVMLNGYSKSGLVDLAKALFERIPDKDVVSWGTIIDAFVQVGRLAEAFTLYRRMQNTGLSPNQVMIVDIISACGQSMAYLEGQQIHSASIKTGLDCSDFVQSTIINFYASCGHISSAKLQFELGSKEHIPSWNCLIAGFVRNGMIYQARQFFDWMPERDVFSWSTIISGYSQSEQPVAALELFRAMVACGTKPNEITMVSVLAAIASLGTLKEGRWVHEYILCNSIPLNDNLIAAIIDMYAKCGSIQTALEVFHKFRDQTCSASPWNAIICGLAMHGHAELSLEIYSELQRSRRIKPNEITFVGVLCACCHAGLVEQGETHFASMKSLYNVEPNLKHYGCMVDLLGRAGRLEEAEKLINSMPMRADVVIWGTLLSASKTHGNIEIGERAADSLAKLEPSHGPSKILLSSMYADAGRWEDAFQQRRMMRTQQMERSVGYSGVV